MTEHDNPFEPANNELDPRLTHVLMTSIDEALEGVEFDEHSRSSSRIINMDNGRELFISRDEEMEGQPDYCIFINDTHVDDNGDVFLISDEFEVYRNGTIKKNPNGKHVEKNHIEISPYNEALRQEIADEKRRLKEQGVEFDNEYDRLLHALSVQLFGDTTLDKEIDLVVAEEMGVNSFNQADLEQLIGLIKDATK